jgi:membrane fusion protein, multidrug efflux system
MPTETIEHKSGAASIEAPATGSTDIMVDRNATGPRTDPGSKRAPNQRITRRRKLLIGVLGAVVIAAAVFGIPWIRFVLSTVSTDDAFVNGHVTFVAPRVHGQVSRVLVDDNNRVRKGDLLIELDKEPFRDAVAVKKAAVVTAEADLQAARATVHGIEAQARSRRWQLQQAIENVENQIAL